MVVVFVEQAHCHRPHNCSGRRVYVQSHGPQRSPAPASWLLAIGLFCTVYIPPPAGSVGNRLGEGSTAAGVLLRPSPRSCAYVTRGCRRALTRRRRPDHIREVLAGLRQWSCDVQRPCCLHTQKCIARRRSVVLPWRGHAVGSGHAGGAFEGLEDSLLHPAAAWT